MAKLACLFLLHLGGILAVASLAATQTWKSVTPSEAVIHLSGPDGLERNTNTFVFLCRLLEDEESRWIPGKLLVSEGQANCKASDSNRVWVKRVFEILDAHPGTTAWIPYLSADSLQNAIPAGTNRNGTTTYPCRARYNTGDRESVVSGVWNGDEQLCYAVHSSVEQTSNREVEIFVLSGLGQLMNLNKI